ncbi:MAG: DUF1003 domain-containing protein [Dehalococcoidia bacterium]|jgi:uncharacterized membrane protein
MEKQKSPLSLDELKKLRKQIRNINIEHRKSLSYLDRIALWITERIGTMGFFFIIFAWTIFWLSWNALAPVELRFDPLPAFVLWLFISNMIQIFLMPLIMIGQNLQGRHAEKKANADYEINIAAEREIETILQHLENLNEKVEKINRRLDDLK